MARGEHPPSCARQWRIHAGAQLWTGWQTTQAIHRCCGVSLLKAHRLSRGWTAQVTIDRLQQLCDSEQLGRPLATMDLLNVWENNRGRPRPAAIDQLARLYRANAVRLGFAADYCDHGDEVPPVVSDSAPQPVLPALVPAAVHPAPVMRHDEADIERRTRFHTGFTVAGITATRRLLAEAERSRQQTNRILAAGTITEGQLDDLDETILRYRRDYLTTPPAEMLAVLMLELDDVRDAAAHRQPAAIQRRLSHATAILAVLSADALMKIGDTRQSHAWYATAKTAADDTGDPRLRALVRAQETMLPYYYGDLARTVRLAREAQAITRNLPCSPAALAAAAEARALARLGDHTNAMNAANTAQNIFTKVRGLPGLAFDFSEQRLHLYLSGIHAHLPDLRRAAQIHEQALALYPHGTAALDPALIQLDRAISMIRAGDISNACQLTETTLLSLPPQHRTSIVFVRTKDVRAAVPLTRRPAKAIQRLNDLLELQKARP
jgi:tetratricopeptide (TPR) repeat protein